jgi:hypothetical protein
MRVYRDDWSNEQREALGERVLALGSPPVLHSVEEALGSLGEWNSAIGEDIRRRRWWRWREVSELSDSRADGTDIASAIDVLLVSGMAYLEWFREDEADTIVPMLVRILLDRRKTMTEAKVHDFAEELLAHLQRDLPLPKINRAFGKLRADAVQKYPKMEEPEWATLLSASPSVE